MFIVGHWPSEILEAESLHFEILCYIALSLFVGLDFAFRKDCLLFAFKLVLLAAVGCPLVLLQSTGNKCATRCVEYQAKMGHFSRSYNRISPPLTKIPFSSRQ